MGRDRGNYRRTILELVLVTGVFAVVSVFLLKIYLTADRLQAEAAAISTATIQCESLAETVKLLGVEEAARRYGMEAGEGYYILRYDKNWERVGERERYQILLIPEGTGDGIPRALVCAGGAELEGLIRQGDMADAGFLCRLPVAMRRRMLE